MLKITSVDFYKSYSHLNIDSIDNKDMFEFAFIGRSNVGKSSLLNHLCNKKIAFVSQTPGKTRLINYFLVNKKFYFVDLPGYGYAKVSKSERLNWVKFIEKYLFDNSRLKGIFLLYDCRRIPNEDDKLISDWAKSLQDVEKFYILTKVDKLSKNELNNQKIRIALNLMVDQKNFYYYSVPKNIGRIDILKRLGIII